MTIEPDKLILSRFSSSQTIDTIRRDLRLPPNQQLVSSDKWPIIGEREPAPGGHQLLRITGAVGNPISLTVQDLAQFPKTELLLDIHCVTRWSKFDVRISGVLLANLLAVVSPSSHAKYVSFVSHSTRRHSSSLRLDEALAADTLIATHLGDEVLTVSQGGPIRNFTPNRYFYKSVKWLTELRLLETDELGFWEAESGYHNEADPWREQRYMASTIDRRQAARLIESRDFSHQDLRGIDAAGRDLRGLRASHAKLRDANFKKCNLERADFSNANLSNAHFENANLRGSDFTQGDLEGANFAGADLREANFSDCSLFGATFFDESTQCGAIIDVTTIMPQKCLSPLTETQLLFVSSRQSRPTS